MRKRLFPFVLGLAAAGWAVRGSAQGPVSSDKPPYPIVGSIERLDPRLDALVPRDARIERLATGFNWAEGPVWVRPAGHLLFSDVPENVIYQWTEEEGVTPFLTPSGYTGTAPRPGEKGSNGLTLDPAGRLVVCQHGDRRIARLDADGRFSAIADRYQGKRFNSPNDLVYRSNGDLYFTDPPYGLPEREKDPGRELPFCGVFRRRANGEVLALTKLLTRPNGIAFSPDEKTLYVAVSDPNRPVWLAFDVDDADGLENGRVLFDASKLREQGRKGLPDGMKVDADGNLFATGPGGVLVFAPDGTHLGTIETGETAANCAFGDDGATLYITADAQLCRIRLTTRGEGF